LYRSYGFLAFIGDDGTKMAFKFSDRAVPSTLSKQVFDEYSVFGIARYGEKTPLDNDKISNLKQLGVCSKALPAASFGLGAGGERPLAICGGGDCTSGGDGSTQCSVTGCSVTCSAGYYACCNSNTVNCKCCQNP
jgi:hypothetical protein